MDNKELADALEKIPELIKAAEIFQRTTEKTISTLAEAVKQRPQATIPEFELAKLEQRIANTKCALPDMESVGRKLASSISSNLPPVILEKVKQALENESVEVKHTHTHSYFFAKDLKEVADNKIRKLCRILCIVLAGLIFLITTGTCLYFSSKNYWGKQFQKVYSSPFITDEERDYIKHNSVTVTIIPKKYKDDPETARQTLKKTQKIIRSRMKEYENNKDFSTDETILWP